MPFLAIPAIAAATIGAGGAVAGGLIARNGSQSIANQQQQQANQLFQRTQPAYNAAQGYYQGLLGGAPGQLSGATAPDVNAVNQQFHQAQQNLVNNSYSRGGGLDAGIANLQAGKAVTLSNLLTGVRPMAAQALTSLAAGQSAQGLQALAGAQQSQAQNAQLQAQTMGGIGSFLTRLLSSGMLGGGQQQQLQLPGVQTPNIPAAISPNMTDPSINSGGGYLPPTAQNAAIDGRWVGGTYIPGTPGY